MPDKSKSPCELADDSETRMLGIEMSKLQDRMYGKFTIGVADGRNPGNPSFLLVAYRTFERLALLAC